MCYRMDELQTRLVIVSPNQIVGLFTARPTRDNIQTQAIRKNKGLVEGFNSLCASLRLDRYKFDQ